jgi:hypothetical protein
VTEFILNPVQPSSDGSTLLPYTGTVLNIQDELHKLASNIASGRNFAGIHYRSDMEEGFILGEQVCISVLKDQRSIYRSDFHGFYLTKFDGTQIVVKTFEFKSGHTVSIWCNICSYGSTVLILHVTSYKPF